MEDDPRMFATLVETVTKPNSEYIQHELDEMNKRSSIILKDLIELAMREVYRKGLTDGFQQGVAAECDRRDREDRGDL
jgi:hypothetical protein